MAKREHKRSGLDLPAELPMTPMIDVVFLLLIYFLMTLQPIDIFAHMDVSRPSQERTDREFTPPPNLLRINIFHDGITINDRPVTRPDMERILGRLAEIHARQTVLILTSVHSTHDQLIGVLDVCSLVGLTNLSVVSTN